jgi:outer membrane protein assembly factor BamB
VAVVALHAGLARFAVSHNLVPALGNRIRLVAAGAAIVVAAPACFMTQSLTRCLSDRDCKLDRVCEAGSCVWPSSATGRAAPPPVPPSAVTNTVAPPAPPGTPPVVTVGPTSPAPPPGSGRSGPPGMLRGMFRGGPDHRGRSQYKAPAKRPDIAWTYETRGPVTSSPTFGPDGSIVFGSHDGRLHVVSSAGKPVWQWPTGDLVFSSPAHIDGGVVYVGSDDDHLYALDVPNRKALWRFQIGSCPQNVGVGPDASRCDVDGGPTVGLNGVLYTGGDAVYAINPDGTLRWRFATGGHVASSPALLPDGTVVAGSQDNLIHAISPEGTKRWDFRTGQDVESAPAIGEDGTVYVGSDDQKLYALSASGTLLWAFNTGGDIRASPAIGPDGTIYVGAFDSLMYAIRKDGTLAWTFRTGDRIISSALIDAAGVVVFGSQDDRLYALEPDGEHRWSVELGGDVDSSPLLASDGTIYVGCDDRKLYALRGK